MTNFLQLVEATEKNSEHPLAKAIVLGILDKEISLQVIIITGDNERTPWDY